MDTQAIQKLIDAEKPAFDYARMFLTTVAWWSVMLFIMFAGLKDEVSYRSLLFITPVLIVGGLFGVFLAVRLNLLTERVAGILLDNSNVLPWLIRPLVKIVFAMLPVTSAWLLVWALMFTDFGK